MPTPATPALLLSAALLLAGCTAKDDQQASSSSRQMAAATQSDSPMVTGEVTEDDGFPSDDRLVGRWTGPEGLTADIAATGPGRFTVSMQYTLDNSGRFPAWRDGDALVVERPGGAVRLTYGAGAESGMKWVEPSALCLIGKLGQEAYCRPGTQSH